MGARVDCRIVRGGEYDGRQGLTFATGISAESAGSIGLCLHTLTIPSGGRAQAHRHVAHESAIYLVSGVVNVWWERLAHHEVMRPCDFMYIPAGVPHLPADIDGDSAFAVLARTDPNEQESVELLPDLDAIVTALLERRDGAARE
jgi:uncharacterized RmlC-like cupin family protein